MTTLLNPLMADISDDAQKYVQSSGSGAFRNKIINGNMRIAQRSTSVNVSSNGYHTLDRWGWSANGTYSITFSRQTFTEGSEPEVGLIHYMRALVNSSSGQTWSQIYQCVEYVRTLNGKTATLSFWARADAARTISIGVHQNFGPGSTSSQVNLAYQAVNLTTSFQKFSLTFDLPSVSGKDLRAGNYLAFTFNFPLSTIFTIDITGVQLEEGSVATPFEDRPEAIELEMCRRYYQEIEVYDGGYSLTGISERGQWQLSTVMRATPTVVSLGNYGSTNINTPGTIPSAGCFYWYLTLLASGGWALDWGYSLSAEL